MAPRRRTALGRASATPSTFRTRWLAAQPQRATCRRLPRPAVGGHRHALGHGLHRVARRGTAARRRTGARPAGRSILDPAGGNVEPHRRRGRSAGTCVGCATPGRTPTPGGRTGPGRVPMPACVSRWLRCTAPRPSWAPRPGRWSAHCVPRRSAGAGVRSNCSGWSSWRAWWSTAISTPRSAPVQPVSTAVGCGRT